MMGTILRVDLNTWKISLESAEPYKEWIGGIGVAERILYNEVKPWVNPYDPENRFIIATGALSGMLFPGAGRIAAVTKSPMTAGIASGNSGGAFAPNLRYAGFEYIIFEGRSIKPVYLFIKNGKAELRDAGEVCGLPVKETVDYLESKHGTQISTMCIGPAGEHLVRFACVTIDRNRVIGKCGFGAVMGSKNLKAVVADGSDGSVTPADPIRFMQKVNDIYDRIDKNQNYQSLMKYGTLCHILGKYKTGGFSFRHGQDMHISDDMVAGYNPDHLVQKYRVYQSSCAGCPVGCQNHHRILEGKYAGLIMGGTPYNSVLNFGTKLDITDFGFCIEATWLCNNLGMDMDAVAELIAWLMECNEKGLIHDSDVDGKAPIWGDKELSLDLIRKMAYREGIGDVLAEGVARTSTLFDQRTRYFASHIKGNDLYEIIRPLIGYGFGAAVSTRGGSHVLGSPLCESSKFNKEEQEVAFKKFGVKTYNDSLAYEGKAEMVKYYDSLTRACSSMGLCVFVSDWQQIQMLDLNDLADLLYCANGMEISTDELRKRMLALINLEKVFNYCHAGFIREDDMPIEREFQEKVKSGPAKGAILDHKKWNEMLSRYYEIHGWDIETGIPTAETLHEYGLDDLVPDIEHPAQNPGHAFK